MRSKKQVNKISKNNFQVKKIKRNMGIELLRYLLIMIIVFYHVQSKFLDSDPQQAHGMWIFTMTIGVPTFFAISGFFSVNSLKSRFLKFASILCSYIVFGLIIQTIFFYSGVINMNPWERLITFKFLGDDLSCWWFLYILLFVTLFAPYINKFIINYRKLAFWSLILFFLLMNFWSCCIYVYGTGTWYGLFDYVTSFKICEGLFFYYLGAYFAKSIFIKILEKKKWIALVSSFLVIVSYLLLVVFFKQFYYGQPRDASVWFFNYTYNDFSIVIVITALALILFFKNCTILNKLWIVLEPLGKSVLPIYLFHGLVWCAIIKINPNWNPSTTSDTLSGWVFTEIYFLILFISTLFGILIYIPQEMFARQIEKGFNFISLKTQAMIDREKKSC